MANDERYSALIRAELERQLANPGSRTRLPAGAELLWQWFGALNRSRSVGMVGLNPLQYCEIEAYARLSGWQMTARHVSLLMQMDATFLDFHSRRRASAEGVKVLPPISAVPLSAGMLDAMFG